MDIKIKDNEKIEDLQRKGLKIIQSPERFCFGCDAVLLSDFARVKKNETVLDLGTGTGIIPILLTAKTTGDFFYALEIQEESAEMAQRSVELNGLTDKIKIITGDIKEASDIFKNTKIDAITVNPPYMNQGGGLLNESSPLAIARHEILVSLDELLRESAKILKFGGRFYMIHRPSRLTEIFRIMDSYKLEPKTMRLIYPKIDKEPTMVLIEGVKNGKPMLKVLPPLIMYKNNNEYTDEILKIYYED